MKCVRIKICWADSTGTYSFGIGAVCVGNILYAEQKGAVEILWG